MLLRSGDDVALLVVGGGPAAHAAVTAYRQHDGPGPVLWVSDDDRAPYERPPLSKGYLRGESGDEALGLDDSVLADSEIELQVSARVTELDAERKSALLSDGRRVRWATTVLCTGSAVLPLPVSGGDDESVLSLRSAADAQRLRKAAAGASSAVVIGSGFIGCEAAVSLARRGLEVTLVSQEDVPQSRRLGEEVGARLRGWLGEENVTVLGGREIEHLAHLERPGDHQIHLSGGEVLPADLVLAVVGVRPRGEIAARAGARMHEGRVVVDERMRTDVPGVLAAGDVAWARNAAAGRHLAVEHWGEALAMGKVAGASAAGRDAAWSEVPGFWSEIGDRVIKQAAWGDGWSDVELVEHAGGGFAAWYRQNGTLVGVLTHDADEDYDRGRVLVEEAAR